MKDVLVVGSYMQDLCFRIETFPNPGETRIGAFHSGPGGKGFNQAVAAHKQDVNTKFIGAVGKDVFADGLRKFIEITGLEASLEEHADTGTGAASVMVNKLGQNQIVVDLGSNDRLSVKFVEENFVNSRITLVQVECNLTATKKALELGKQSGSFNILNPAPINADLNMELLKLANLITPNETEFIFLLDHLFGKKLKSDFYTQADNELHALCREVSADSIVITLGDKGSFISLKERFLRIPPIAVNVKDTTGAGDAFSGGLAAGMIKFNADVITAAKFATVVAGLSTEKNGTAPAMPTSIEVNKRFVI